MTQYETSVYGKSSYLSHFEPLTIMDHEALFPIKVMAYIALAGTVAAGVYMVKNNHAMFGFDPEVPSDNSSARGYGKAQMWLLWLLALKVFGYFAFCL